MIWCINTTTKDLVLCDPTELRRTASAAGTDDASNVAGRSRTSVRKVWMQGGLICVTVQTLAVQTLQNFIGPLISHQHLRVW